MKRLLALSALGSLLILPGCKKPEPSTAMDFRHNPTGQGTKVATFGNDSITAEELQQRLSEMTPFSRARYQTDEQKKQFVEEMARFEILAAEAANRKLHQHPDVIAMAKQVMVRKLLEQELDQKPTPPTDAEIQAYYDSHKQDYVKPEMVRLSHIFLPAPEGSPQRAKAKTQAEKLLKEVKALAPQDSVGFARLAREHNQEPRTKSLDGDMRYLSLEEVGKQYDPKLAEAATQLQEVGAVATHVIETRDGFHILKLQGRQRALNQTVQDARSQITSILQSERRARAFHALVDELKKKSGFKLDDAALAKVKVDVTAPTQQPKGPPPQLLPAPPLPPSRTAAALPGKAP